MDSCGMCYHLCCILVKYVEIVVAVDVCYWVDSEVWCRQSDGRVCGQ